MILPNFIIVGAAKGGTTSLHRYLAQHPGAYMSPIKETNFFSQAEMYPELFNRQYRSDVAIDLKRYLSGSMRGQVHSANVERWEDYILLFRNVQGETAIGETSPSYLYSPSAAEQISHRLPNARIVMILRNPIDRAYSHYLMNLRLGKTLVRNFIQEVEEDYRCLKKGWGVSRLYLELGLYSAQVRRYYQQFPAEQLHVIIYDDYRAQPDKTMAALCRFLQLDDQFGIDLSQHYNRAGLPRFKHFNYLLTQVGLVNVGKRMVPDAAKSYVKSLFYSDRAVPRIGVRECAYLAKFYREDVARLSELLGRDLSFWVESTR